MCYILYLLMHSFAIFFYYSIFTYRYLLNSQLIMNTGKGLQVEICSNLTPSHTFILGVPSALF